jgi:DNA polymerase-3 subunit gamma/tau
MSYQVLARKWRPQNFASLVGQEPIVTALRNALREGRIAQAYLFSGIRGVGKTTAARVLAKALNCEKGPAADPCNECLPCREITRGSDLDVIEVDAATYSKVEQVRELTESLKYGPARDRYKVVVLDEIHRLSRQAFDALLKIVEEPPPHLVFIFATTEIDAVPATILSRCQEYHFRRVPSLEVAAHLRQICDAEGIAASDTALRLIARAGEGSVRDAVALLDQLATFGSGAIPDEEAVRLLGGLDTALFHQLLVAILGGDAAGVSSAVRRVEDEGWDPRHVYSQFLAFCRDALHLAMGGDPKQVDLPGEEAATLATLARGAGYENLLRLLHQLLSSEPIVRRSESGALAVEIAWLRAAELPKLTRVEEILAGQVPAQTGPQSAPKPAPARSAAPPPRAPAAPRTAVGHDGVPAFIDEVSRRKQPLAGYLQAAEELTFEDGCLRVVLPADDRMLRPRLENEANRQVIEEALAAVWGAGTRWRLALGQIKPETKAEAKTEAKKTAAAGAPEPAAPRQAAAPRDGAADDFVQTVLEIFKGRVVETFEGQASLRED